MDEEEWEGGRMIIVVSLALTGGQTQATVG